MPQRFGRLLPAHQVQTTKELGWDRLRNGELLRVAASQFDAFLTVDKNIKHEQNLSTLPVAVVVLMARSNRLPDLVPFVRRLEEALAYLKPRALIEVELK